MGIVKDNSLVFIESAGTQGDHELSIVWGQFGVIHGWFFWEPLG
jgi:hypothetical protein